MKKLLISLLFILLPSIAFGATNITNEMVNGGPYILGTVGETYILTENITCNTSCFAIKASGITLDLNGYTITFGNANGTSILNSKFANWTGPNADDWTVLSGTLTKLDPSWWPGHTFDGELSPTASIKSSTVTLKNNQTYWYGAWIRGFVSTDSYTVYLKKASDNSTLASTTVTGSDLTRGFASEGYLYSTDHLYKPTTGDVDVYLQIDCAGTLTKRISMAEIKPAKHYGIFHYRWLNTNYFPDLSSSYFGGGHITGITITNGTITQGNGEAVQSYAVMLGEDNNNLGGTLSDLTINMNGYNTGSVYFYPWGAYGFTIDNVDTNTTNDGQFNRMHTTPEFDLYVTATGNNTVTGCDILNSPEYGIRINGPDPSTISGITNIYNNTIRPNAKVTEPYGILVYKANNLNIYNNTIQPFSGRGILLDLAGTYVWQGNINIYNNIISDIYETRNLEYAATELEAVGIRVRNWGDESPTGLEKFTGLKIYNNNISVSTDSSGVHAAYGINITATSSQDNIEIYGNTITATLTSGGPSYYVAGIAIQGSHSNDTNPTGYGTYKIYNNTITSNDRGIQLGGNDGQIVLGYRIYLNEISSTNNAFSFYTYGSAAIWSDVDIYCNDITNTGASSYPFFFSGDYTPTVSDIMISNNLLTNGNSNGYEVWTNKNYSTSVIFCNNGTIDVTGGGSVGSASTPCQDGTTGCYTTAGAGDQSPTVTTTDASSITQNTASAGGNVVSDGGDPVTARGTCWSTSPNPTTADNKTEDGTGTGVFVSSLTGLSANTVYYYRAYATNTIGTSFGSQKQFATLPSGPSAPTVTTTGISGIGFIYATSGGTITSDGGAPITAKGVCWNTGGNPTISDSKTSDGTGSGAFASHISGLSPNTTYYVRAYATNSVGTSYGNQVSFTTTLGMALSVTSGNTIFTIALGGESEFLWW